MVCGGTDRASYGLPIDPDMRTRHMFLKGLDRHRWSTVSLGLLYCGEHRLRLGSIAYRGRVCQGKTRTTCQN